jgi:hypothetical protein
MPDDNKDQPTKGPWEQTSSSPLYVEKPVEERNYTIWQTIRAFILVAVGIAFLFFMLYVAPIKMAALLIICAISSFFGVRKKKGD